MPSLINDTIEVMYKQKPEEFGAAEYADHFSMASDTTDFLFDKIEALAGANDVVRLDAIRHMRKTAHLPIKE